MDNIQFYDITKFGINEKIMNGIYNYCFKIILSSNCDLGQYYDFEK